MKTIQLEVETTKFLGTPPAVMALLDLLSTMDGGRWVPAKWNSAEPIRYPLTSESLPKIIAEWTQERTRPAGWHGGDLLFASRHPRLIAGAKGVRGRSGRPNRLYVWLDRREFSTDDGPDRLRTLLDSCRAWSTACYGWVGDEREWRRPAGGTCRDRLEQIHWLNYFGPAYVEMFGRERLLTAPAHRVEACADGGMLLWAAARPDSPELLGSDATVVRIEDHLGADAFAGRGYPEVPCRVPALDWSDVTLTDPDPRLAHGGDVTPFETSLAANDDDLARSMVGVAEDAVRFFEEQVGVRLDFRMASLETLEHHMDRWYKALRTGPGGRLRQERLGQLAALFGAYVGEVLRRATDARWRYDEVVAGGARVVALEHEGLRVFPLNKVHQRLTRGAVEGLALYANAVLAAWGHRPGRKGAPSDNSAPGA